SLRDRLDPAARGPVEESCDIGAVRFHAKGPAAWALLDPQARAVRLYDRDGALLTEFLDVVFDTAVDGVVVGGGSAGVGRRAEMAGGTVGQCLAWELRDVVGQLWKLPVDRVDDAAGRRGYGRESGGLGELVGGSGEASRVALGRGV